MTCVKEADPLRSTSLNFFVLSDKVSSDEFFLKEIFRFGLSEAVRSWLPEGIFNVSLKDIMDYALIVVGSSFTVGVAEEERNITSVTEMADTTSHSANPESSQYAADRRESRPVTTSHPESCHVTADHPVSPCLS